MGSLSIGISSTTKGGTGGVESIPLSWELPFAAWPLNEEVSGVPTFVRFGTPLDHPDPVMDVIPAIALGHILYKAYLKDLIREYPILEGWYARLPGLQEPVNYNTKFEIGIYEEQVKSGYRLPLHPFALRFFEHYRMAPGQLLPNGWRKLAGLIYLVQTSGYKPDATDFMRDFENPGKPSPNNLTKHILSHIKLRGGLSIDEPLSEEQLEWAKIIPPKPIPAGLSIPPPPPAIRSVSSAETIPLEMASGSGKSPQGGFLGVLQKAKGKRKEKQPSVEFPPAPKRTRVILPERSPWILEQVSIEDDPIFRPRWTLRRDDLGMPNSQVSEQHLLHGILPCDKEVFQNQTHKTFACSFTQAVDTMYASGFEMLSRFEMARQVAVEEAQQKREAVKQAQEDIHRVEELSKQEADHLAQIATLEKRLERAKRRATEEVTKARDQGIRDFLDVNAGDEWLKKRTEDGLEIYELGFAKAKEMFAERFPDIPLDDFVLLAVVSPSGETAMPSEAGDAAASHLPGEVLDELSLSLLPLGIEEDDASDNDDSVDDGGGLGVIKSCGKCSSGKFRTARLPLMLNAARSYARAASSALSNVPSHMRCPCLDVSRISDAYLPHGRLRTPRIPLAAFVLLEERNHLPLVWAIPSIMWTCTVEASSSRPHMSLMVTKVTPLATSLVLLLLIVMAATSLVPTPLIIGCLG
ncbi:hypothetical protein RJ640_022315 [Escallonia rubra]|uniref:Transposase (putative) gypsy type domain-containing protein n=1 Tax=Escallonia rubra TaxID=112253 RepID=A0AA88U3T6_9ASTE|nr:hypothetical protein RJ640_022315 [Escallonia rubra]